MTQMTQPSTATTGTTVSEDMTETTIDTDLETPVDQADEAEISEFTSETTPTRISHIEPAGATGRRKRAIARVRIVPGSGNWTINGRSLDEYFPNKVHQQLVNSPFVELEIEDKYDVVARITGGGASGQAGALRLGVARALNNADVDNNRPTLKKAGFLTRDARVTERKKAGLKKARKAPQYSKR
jgi:small subunit ribosomal protein S9